MTALGVILLILSALFVSALVLDLVACGRRRWRAAVRLSRILAFAGPVSLAFALAVVVALASQTNAAEKARTLAMGIAEIMNCGVLLLVVAVASAVVWAVAAWRLRCEATNRHKAVEPADPAAGRS
jgi:hypothetical protein